jgi:hypothetical protein
MFAKGSLLACALFGVCTAFTGDPVDVAASGSAAGGQRVADPADALPRGHEQRSGPIHASIATGRDRFTSGRVLKPEAVRLDSIAPRERSPNGSDRQQPPHRKARKTPSVRQGAIEATGGIPVEVIRRILRQNHGRYRQCYEKGLERHPKLRGEVRVRFVIELDGSVSNSRDDGSTLPDASVIRCIGGALGRLSFPKHQGPWAGPEAGPMSVLVHFWLSPG